MPPLMPPPASQMEKPWPLWSRPTVSFSSPSQTGSWPISPPQWTIVHWGGEIGRLPVCEGELNDTVGRDHIGQGFTIWLAGGGIKGGMTYGETDEVGHKAAVNVVTPNDYQATILHLLGIDHQRLVYHASGREQRLIDGRPARIVQAILA